MALLESMRCSPPDCTAMPLDATCIQARGQIDRRYGGRGRGREIETHIP
jgi:hypothetical protein